MRKTLVIFLTVAILCVLSAGAFADEPKTKQIIITPGNLKIEVWVDRNDSTYYIGDDIRIYFRTNRDAFVTLFDIDPAGRVQLLFPTDRNGDNFVTANRTYELPTGGQKYTVGGPAGTEVIYAIASIYYTQFHQQFSSWDPRTLHNRVLDTLKQYPRARWDVQKKDVTVKERVSTRTRTLYVRSIESDVAIYLDGEYEGNAPKTLRLTPGDHQIVAMKEGYRVDIRDVSAQDDFYYSTWTPRLERLSTVPAGGSSQNGGSNDWLNWLNIEFQLNL